jgi:hypothetical protein
MNEYETKINIDLRSDIKQHEDRRLSMVDQAVSGRMIEKSMADETADLAALERELAEKTRQFAELEQLARTQAARAASLEQERETAAQQVGEAKRLHEEAQAELAQAEPRRASAERMRLQVESELAQLRDQHQQVVSSTLWRVSRPIRRLGSRFSPRMRRKLRSGVRLVWWALTLQLRARLRQRKAVLLTHPATAAGDAQAPPTTIEHSINFRFSALEPLRTYPAPRTGRRLSIVTDSINAGYLYGGVGTAIIFATLLADRIQADLRLITRVHQADAGRVGAFIGTSGIIWKGDVSCVFSPSGDGADVPVSPADMFLTTSWWTTQAVRRAVDPGRIVYLLQEDERMFYPHGDERLRCAETLAADDINFVINSELMFRHLTRGESALPNIARRGVWFEPAFPESIYYIDDSKQNNNKRKNFLFYARPTNLRNLYWRGLEAIAAALQDGTLRPEEWNFTFVGRDLKQLVLPFGVRPMLLENLSWSDYAALIRQTDLGLSLIDTPHPSYPPLDLAASGAVAVTNQHGSKLMLAAYSENILCVPPSVAGLRQGLEDGVKLVFNLHQRRANYARNGIARDWSTTLEPALRRCTEWLA